jgi:hypothetical protein
LCAAVCNGVTQLASTLLDSGFDVADIDKYGKTALTNTASCRYEQCVQKLGWSQSQSQPILLLLTEMVTQHWRMLHKYLFVYDYYLFVE